MLDKSKTLLERAPRTLADGQNIDDKSENGMRYLGWIGKEYLLFKCLKGCFDVFIR
jgi:hypothetical protein